jgi:hypothetical protein
MEKILHKMKSATTMLLNFPAWLPLFVLTTATLALHSLFPPWALMWCLAAAIFFGFKWMTWRRAMITGIETTAARSFAYLFLWLGMDAEKFLGTSHTAEKPAINLWFAGTAKMLLGISLVWGFERLAGNGLVAGWIGVIGMIFSLHFGAFYLLALFWQYHGICAQPLMQSPVLSKSLSEFWGRRWNSGFRDLSFGLIFRRLRKQFGVRSATMLTFVISGVIHDLVISFPANGAYGLPTAYFTIQGTGILLEHSAIGKRIGLGAGWQGRLFALSIVALPAFWLFHPPFVHRVIIPFMQAIGALK